MNKGYFTDVDDDTMRLGTFYYAGGIYYILRQWLYRANQQNTTGSSRTDVPFSQCGLT